MSASVNFFTEADFLGQQQLDPLGTGLFGLVNFGERMIPGHHRLWFLSLIPVSEAGVGFGQMVFMNSTLTVDAGFTFTLDGSSLPNCPLVVNQQMRFANFQRVVCITGPPANAPTEKMECAIRDLAALVKRGQMTRTRAA